MTLNPITLIDRLLFSPAPSWPLGALRFFFFGWLFFWYLGRDFTFVAEHPAIFWTPIDLLRAVGLSEQPSLATVGVAQVVWKASLLLACIGFFTRSSALLACVLGAYLLALTHSFHKINHSDAALVLAMLVFAVSRCGDRWSVDALIRTIRTSGRDEAPEAGAEYRWPIFTLQSIWVIVFFLSGVSKLRNGGLGWMFDDNLSNIIVRNQVGWSPMFPYGVEVAQIGWLCKAMAVGTVVLELGAALTLFSRWARVIVVPGLLGMQLGIYLLMSDNFTQFMALYMVWLPWTLLGAAGVALAPMRRQTVLYDGQCGLCGRTVAVLRRLDIFKRLEIRDVVGEWGDLQREYPTLTQEDCLRDMHAIDGAGRITKGYYAYRSMARVLPLLWPVLPLMYLPGAAWIGTRVYTYVASRRASGACALPQR